MKVSTGPAGKRRVVVHMGADRYLESHPHALIPDMVMVELVHAGRVTGVCKMIPDEAMQLELDILAGKARATSWLQFEMTGHGVHAQSVMEIPMRVYPIPCTLGTGL